MLKSFDFTLVTTFDFPLVRTLVTTFDFTLVKASSEKSWKSHMMMMTTVLIILVTTISR